MMYSSLYQLMIKNVYPGKTIKQSLKAMERTQWLSRQELEAIQLNRIQQLVAYAYDNVPFYRKRYRREDIHPQDIKSVKDFQALPFLTRNDINDHRDDLISRAKVGPVFKGITSGSTGTPMQFVMERTAVWSTFVFNAICRGWYGVRPGDKRAFVTAMLEDYEKWHWKEKLSSKIKRYRYLNVRTMTESTMQNFAEMLEKWQPDMIRAYPSSLAIFANYLKERNITSLKPKLVEVTAEKVTPHQRQLFHEVFHAPVADHYASLEIYSYAYQCPDGGLHVNNDRYLELAEKGQVVRPGRMGEVVITALNQYAMPFIRYKNGDVAIYESDGCSCGRGIPILREVVGRNCDLLVNSSGRVVHWSPVIVIMMNRKKVRQYQIYQPDSKNVEVRLVCKEKVDKAYLNNIRYAMQPLFGKSMQIAIKQLDNIELTSAGKYRIIVSKVKPDFM